jgi:hypothetical protein
MDQPRYPENHDVGSAINSNSRLLQTLIDNPNAIINEAPDQRFKLGYVSAVGLVVNRMIGPLILLRTKF